MCLEAEISETVAVDIYNWLREVCSTKLLQTPVVLGGPGVVVQADESQFKHKPKVKWYTMRSQFGFMKLSLIAS